MREITEVEQADEQADERIWRQVNVQLLDQVYERAERQVYYDVSVQCFGKIIDLVVDGVYGQVKRNSLR
jgi:hypothetical protein